MKNKYLLAGLAGIGIFLLILSCKTTPPAEEKVSAPSAGVSTPVPGQDGPPDQAALENLAEAKGRAEASRSRAFDFDGPIYFIEETDAADALYVLAESQPVTTQGEVQEAIALYTRTAVSFDQIFDQTIPLYMQNLWGEITAARDAALQLDITNVFPSRFETADAIKDEAAWLYEEKDYYPAAASGLSVLDMYAVLTVSAIIWQTRAKIEEQNFHQYDVFGHNLANEVFQAAMDAYDAMAISEALDKAEEALLRFNLVLDNAWQIYAEERREASAEEQQAALDLKAHIAVEDRFTNAQNLYLEAEDLFFVEQYEKAADLYLQAEYLFAGAAIIAEEKRRIAEEAIQAAEIQAANSEAIARDAETLLEGGN